MTGSGDDDEAAIAREQPAADDVGTAWLARPAIPERPSFREAQGQDAYTKSNVEWLLHHADTVRVSQLRSGELLVPCSFGTGYDMDEVDRWVEDEARAAAARRGAAQRTLPDRQELRVVERMFTVFAALVGATMPFVLVYQWTHDDGGRGGLLAVSAGLAFLASVTWLAWVLRTGGELAAAFTPAGLEVRDVGPEPIPWDKVDYARHRVRGHGRSRRYDVRLHLVDGTVHEIRRLGGTDGRSAREFGVLVGRWRDRYAPLRPDS